MVHMYCNSTQPEVMQAASSKLRVTKLEGWLWRRKVTEDHLKCTKPLRVPLHAFQALLLTGTNQSICHTAHLRSRWGRLRLPASASKDGSTRLDRPRRLIFLIVLAGL